MNNINTLSKQSSQISRASSVWGSRETGRPLKTSATPIMSPNGDQTFSIGVPESQINRTEDILRSGLSDGPKPYSNLRTRGQSEISIKFTIEPASEGFRNIFFHDMDKETFYRIVSRLKLQGINTIGADTELSEDTIELNKKSMETLHKTGKMKKDDHTIKFIKEFIQKEVKRLKESINDSKTFKQGDRVHIKGKTGEYTVKSQYKNEKGEEIVSLKNPKSNIGPTTGFIVPAKNVEHAVKESVNEERMDQKVIAALKKLKMEEYDVPVKEYIKLANDSEDGNEYYHKLIYYQDNYEELEGHQFPTDDFVKLVFKESVNEVSKNKIGIFYDTSLVPDSGIKNYLELVKSKIPSNYYKKLSDQIKQYDKLQKDPNQRDDPERWEREVDHTTEDMYDILDTLLVKGVITGKEHLKEHLKESVNEGSVEWFWDKARENPEKKKNYIDFWNNIDQQKGKLTKDIVLKKAKEYKVKSEDALKFVSDMYADIKFESVNKFIQKEVKALIKKKAKPVKEGAIRQWVIERSPDMILKVPQSTEMSRLNKRDFQAFLKHHKIDFDHIADDEMDSFSHYLIYSDISPEMLKDLQDTYHARF